LAFCECVGFHDCAYSRCKITQASLGYIGEKYSTNTQARKMQLKQELHNLQKNKMNINDYSTKVKNLADALASIGAPVDDEDLVAVTLNGFGKDYS